MDTRVHVIVESRLEGGNPGWIPSLPDMRDYTETNPKIAEIASKLKLPSGKEVAEALPVSVDLRSNFPDIEDQGTLGFLHGACSNRGS